MGKLKCVTKAHFDQISDSGALFMSMKLAIVSGHKDDEWYSHCLIEPRFVEYTRMATVFDVQSVYDNWQLLASSIHDIIYPFFGGISYLLTWREIPVTLFFMCALV